MYSYSELPEPCEPINRRPEKKLEGFSNKNRRLQKPIGPLRASGMSKPPPENRNEDESDGTKDAGPRKVRRNSEADRSDAGKDVRIEYIVFNSASSCCVSGWLLLAHAYRTKLANSTQKKVCCRGEKTFNKLYGLAWSRVYVCCRSFRGIRHIRINTRKRLYLAKVSIIYNCG